MSKLRLYGTTSTWCLILFLLIQSYDSSAQGCSDAGFCTMGAMRPNQNAPGSAAIRMRSIEIGQYFGYTKFKDFIYAYTADFNFQIGKKMGAQVKIPYMHITGPLGKNSGFGDVSLSITRGLIQKKNWQLSSTIGIKFPLRFFEEPFSKNVNYSNALSEGGQPLPMYYQTSLGTFDAVWGASIRTKKWLIATGIQYSFNQNDNMFLWGAWKGSEDSVTASEYPKAKHLKRGTDVMFRVERNFRFSRFNFYLGLLPIYRINQDVISDAKNNRLKAEGSSGLALTGLFGAGYQFNIHHGIKVLIGKSIHSREWNPDGLSRLWVTSVNYEIKF